MHTLQKRIALLSILFTGLLCISTAYARTNELSKDLKEKAADHILNQIAKEIKMCVAYQDQIASLFEHPTDIQQHPVKAILKEQISLDNTKLGSYMMDLRAFEASFISLKSQLHTDNIEIKIAKIQKKIQEKRPDIKTWTHLVLNLRYIAFLNSVEDNIQYLTTQYDTDREHKIAQFSEKEKRIIEDARNNFASTRKTLFAKQIHILDSMYKEHADKLMELLKNEDNLSYREIEKQESALYSIETKAKNSIASFKETYEKALQYSMQNFFHHPQTNDNTASTDFTEFGSFASKLRRLVGFTETEMIAYTCFIGVVGLMIKESFPFLKTSLANPRPTLKKFFEENFYKKHPIKQNSNQHEDDSKSEYDDEDVTENDSYQPATRGTCRVPKGPTYCAIETSDNPYEMRRLAQQPLTLEKKKFTKEKVAIKDTKGKGNFNPQNVLRDGYPRIRITRAALHSNPDRNSILSAQPIPPRLQGEQNPILVEMLRNLQRGHRLPTEMMVDNTRLNELAETMDLPDEIILALQDGGWYEIRIDSQDGDRTKFTQWFWHNSGGKRVRFAERKGTLDWNDRVK